MRVLRYLGHLLGEGLVAVAMLMTAVALFWVMFGFRPFMLPFVDGKVGRYGVIEDATHFMPGTELISFQAQYIPSRIVWLYLPIAPLDRVRIPWQLAESVVVTIEYRLPDHLARIWEKTYTSACNIEQPNDCVSLYQVHGILLHGQGFDTDTRAWVYLRGQIIPHIGPTPVPASPPLMPAPMPQKPKQKRHLPGLTVAHYSTPVHKTGAFSFDSMVKCRYGKHCNQRLWSYWPSVFQVGVD